MLAVVLLGQLRGIGMQLMLDPEPARPSEVRRAATTILRLGLEA